MLLARPPPQGCAFSIQTETESEEPAFEQFAPVSVQGMLQGAWNSVITVTRCDFAPASFVVVSKCRADSYGAPPRRRIAFDPRGRLRQRHERHGNSGRTFIQ